MMRLLKACIPGCEELETTEDQGFRAVAKMKVVPVSARFKGKVTLSDLDPPTATRFRGKARASSRASRRAGRSRSGRKGWRYVIELSGRGADRRQLAQLGQRLINGTAKKLDDEFFANFAKAL
jgi:hypothetical protein